MYSQIASNKRRSLAIMFFFLLFGAGLALLFEKLYGPGTAIFVFSIALIYALISYFAGSSWSLAVNGATEIKRTDNPKLWRTVENLSITDGLPMPRVFIINDPSPNAFSTGRDPNHSAVCVTSGLLDIMDDKELEGVLAHEMGHVKNYDIRVAMLAFALTVIISVVADFFLRMTFFRSYGNNNNEEGENNQIFLILGIIAAVLAPIIAKLIQLAISRKREYLADATGALTTRYPEGLASALEKIENTGSVLKRQNTSTAHFFFANPLRKHSITSWFDTHPPIEERIKRLRNMDTHV